MTTSSQVGTSETEPPPNDPLAAVLATFAETVATAGPADVPRMLRGLANINLLLARHGDAHEDADAFYLLAWTHAALELATFGGVVAHGLRSVLVPPAGAELSQEEKAGGPAPTAAADAGEATAPATSTESTGDASGAGASSQDGTELEAPRLVGFGLPHPVLSGE